LSHCCPDFPIAAHRESGQVGTDVVFAPRQDYADYDRAAALDPNLDLVDLGRGRLFLEANWPQSAKLVLDRFHIR